MSVTMLLKRALPGAKASINGHIDRGERIAAAIQERFQISEPHQWQVKHLRWVLERWAEPLSRSTRYDGTPAQTRLLRVAASSNPSVNLAPFGRWTLRDKAAPRRLALLQGRAVQ